MPEVVAAAPEPEPMVEMAEMEMSAQSMEVPERIPPYRPLRPTPIMTPAIRTPLYIPSIPEQTAERQPVDEGTIFSDVVTAVEFPLPMSLRPTLSSVEAVAVPDELSDQVDAAEIVSASMAPAVDAQDAGSPPASTGEGEEMPWIEAFLAATPVIPMRTVATPLVSEIVGDSDMAGPSEPAASEHSVEEWPLAEAAEELRVLGAQLDVPIAPETAGAPFGASAEPAALPAWGDEDLMDIMPIRHSGKTPLSSPAVVSDGDLWAERARKAQEEAQVLSAMLAAPELPVESVRDAEVPESTAEEAAHALELLAQRVRTGALTLPSYDPRMGEPAALVAALAALLGVRLR
jgi:hypothetical protein